MTQRALFLKTSLTGGTTDALDGIAGNARGVTSDTTNIGIQEFDVAITNVGSHVHIHEYQTGVSPWTESSPDVIIPDTASVSGSAWILLGSIQGADITARGLLHSILDSSTDDEFVLKANNKSLMGTTTGAAETSLIKLNTSNKVEIANGLTDVVLAGTTITAAQLLTLIDNSIADTLHRHSELVASDGSPDPALSVDANGNVGALVGKLYAGDSHSGTLLESVAVSGVPFSAYRKSSTESQSLFYAVSDVGGAGTQVFKVECDGDTFNINNSYGALSDERLKENITDANIIEYLDKFMSIRFTEFVFKNNTKKKLFGIIAQEIEKIFPALVKTRPKRLAKNAVFEEQVVKVETDKKDDDGNPIYKEGLHNIEIESAIEYRPEQKSLKYSVLTLIGTFITQYLVKKYQEQQKQIDSILERLDKLEKE